MSEERVNIFCVALIKTFSTFLALSLYGPALVSPQVAGTEAISLLQPPPMVPHHPLSLTLHWVIQMEIGLGDLANMYQ